MRNLNLEVKWFAQGYKSVGAGMWTLNYENVFEFGTD